MLLSVSHNIVSVRHNIAMSSGKIRTIAQAMPVVQEPVESVVSQEGGGMKGLRQQAMKHSSSVARPVSSVASSVAKPANRKMDKFISFNF